MNNIDIKQIQPIGARVLIHIEEAPKTTTSGLALAEVENPATPVIGTVMIAGDKSAFDSGDVVLFRRYSVDELKFQSPDGEVKLHLVEDEEIVAYVK